MRKNRHFQDVGVLGDGLLVIFCFELKSVVSDCKARHRNRLNNCAIPHEIICFPTPSACDASNNVQRYTDLYTQTYVILQVAPQLTSYPAWPSPVLAS
jgi:hypothetical protein